MSTVVSERNLDIRRALFNYGWVNVVIAAVAMAATFPGRTHGLGMFTESLKRDFGLSNTFYGQLNLWATLIGALFCIPIGWLVDRFGSRWVLTANYIAFGASILWMSIAEGWPALFGCLILTRGLGQSALSVVSITLVAKWFKGSSLSFAMAVYSVLMSAMFAGITKLVSMAILDGNWEWRMTMAVMGWAMLAGPTTFSMFFTRSTPPEHSDDPLLGAHGMTLGELSEGEKHLKHALTAQPPSSHYLSEAPPQADAPASADIAPRREDGDLEGATLSDALRTPAFWVFSLSVSFYGLISSGIFLFNEEIFRDRNIAREAYHGALMLSFIVGLASKFVAAWLSGYWPINRLLALSMAVLMAALLALPLVQEAWHAYLYAIAMSISGGVVALVFFAVWGQAFGRREVGRIQGIAQMLTVLASAVGPLLFGSCRDHTGSYLPMFVAMAPVAFCLAVACWWVRLPKKNW
jgi:MFS family permease